MEVRLVRIIKSNFEVLGESSEVLAKQRHNGSPLKLTVSGNGGERGTKGARDRPTSPSPLTAICLWVDNALSTPEMTCSTVLHNSTKYHKSTSQVLTQGLCSCIYPTHGTSTMVKLDGGGSDLFFGEQFAWASVSPAAAAAERSPKLGTYAYYGSYLSGYQD